MMSERAPGHHFNGLPRLGVVDRIDQFSGAAYPARLAANAECCLT